MDQPSIQNTGKNNTEAYRALLEIDQSERTFKSRQNYSHAYILSLFIPPFGIYFFIKYVFFGDGSVEDTKAGYISLVLTIISTLISIWTMRMFFKQATSILPNHGNNIIEELITPENQKKFKELLQ